MKIIKMRYSIEPRDRIYVKGYGFLSFAKNMGKNLSNKYSQKLIDSTKKSTMDAIKTASKTAIQKTAEATGDLIDNKTIDKITSVSKHFPKKLYSRNEDEIEIPKERYISTEKRQQLSEDSVKWIDLGQVPQKKMQILTLAFFAVFSLKMLK